MFKKNMIVDIRKSLNNFKEFIKDSAILNSIVMKTPSLNGIESAPVTIFPSPYPEELFYNVARFQKDFHLLFNRLSRDYDVLYEILKNVIASDEYICKLWDIYKLIDGQANSQSVFLSLVRNDYMICLPIEHQSSSESLARLVMKPGVSLKQIEYNLMASSFAGLAQNVSDFHKLNLRLVGVDSTEILDKIPTNHPADGFAKGMICAWKLYNKEKAAILFIVNARERNIFDQRILEQCIYQQNSSILVMRKTFEECFTDGKIESDNSFWINDYEIAVVYFRHGYAPEHFYNEQIWQSKLMLEKSKAIKCPSIQQMLVNTKLVQQALCNYTFLRQYLSDLIAQELIETFANQYLLTDLEKVEAALQFPDRFVLKPQREGGGNNFFDNDLFEKLNEIKDTEEKYQYVLMERIYPASCKNYILKPDGEITEETIVSELGIYGVFLG